jgi:hypothetical protein
MCSCFVFEHLGHIERVVLGVSDLRPQGSASFDRRRAARAPRRKEKAAQPRGARAQTYGSDTAVTWTIAQHGYRPPVSSRPVVVSHQRCSAARPFVPRGIDTDMSGSGETNHPTRGRTRRPRLSIHRRPRSVSWSGPFAPTTASSTRTADRSLNRAKSGLARSMAKRPNGNGENPGQLSEIFTHRLSHMPGLCYRQRISAYIP